jgi:Cu+-exporting ATPase
VASLERASEHPLASAIVRAAEAKHLVLAEVTSFESFTGKGVVGIVEGREAAVGNAQLMRELGVQLSRGSGANQNEGKTVMYISVDKQFAGALTVSDSIKANTPAALAALNSEGIHVVMLTGDQRRTAEVIGITEFEAEVSPDRKQEVVRDLQAKGRVVAMAGDGINDAPALAQANVGIAMGTGTDIAIESAGITLLKGDLVGIVRARKLSEATMRNIRQNLFFAFIYNALGVPIAAGALYPFFGLLLSPIIAAAAMSFSSVSVITNALRLRNLKLEL